MPQFADQPDHAREQPTLRLIRIPAGPGLIGVATSERLIACPVHWWQGRTTPHEPEACEACENNRTYTWKTYFGIWIPKTAEHVILEVTARTSKAFEDYQEKYGSLRGCHFTSARIGGRATARCFTRTKPADLSGIDLPNPPPLKKILLNIWGYTEDGKQTEKRRKLSASADPNFYQHTATKNRITQPSANGNGDDESP